ncbi:MAG: SRPBCC family protein [Bacteroidia bacterium]
MSILTVVLLVLAAIIVLPLIIAFFLRKNYFIERTITLNAPNDKVFAYLKLQKNQEQFNKWVMVDPQMKREFKGTDGTVGFKFAWDGNKHAGQGELEIKKMIEGKHFETEVRFVRPMPGIAKVKWSMEPVGNQTKITWSNASKLKYPVNIMVPMVEKLMGRDMDISLQNLKNILEK